MFIDEIEIFAASGKGGDGAVHFRREKYVPRGGPDGGDGGNGASVILEVKPTLNTLSTFRNRKQFRAKNGLRGGGNNQTGRSADDLIIHVPPGTLVYDVDTNDEYDTHDKNHRCCHDHTYQQCIPWMRYSYVSHQRLVQSESGDCQ